MLRHGLTTADLAYTALAVAALIPITVFLGLYGFRARWWESWIGRALLASKVGLWLLLAITLLRWLLGTEYPWRDVVRLSAMTVVAVGAWLMLYALAKEMLPPLRRRKRPRDDGDDFGFGPNGTLH